MKRITLLTMIFAAILSLTIATKATAQSSSWPTIIPAPVTCNLSSVDYIPFQKVTIATDDATAIKWANSHFAVWYKKLAPKASQVAYNGSESHKEAYSITIANNEVKISAKSIDGVRYALQSLRQIVIPGRNTKTVESYIVPTGTISDYPSMEFRGMHICWFPETKEWEIERMIRMAGYYKINYIVLEQWGTYQSKVAPWLSYPNPPMTKKAIKRMVALSKELGITLIPQLNIFGHASASRIGSGKHSTLDINPKYQPLFEPQSGWNWCLSNPETKKVIESVMVEMLKDFDNPPFFHIGCDEADTPSCPECSSRPYSELLVDYIKFAHKVLADRGVRAMMWQDMFLKKGDPRWKKYKANGTVETSKALLTFPKDIVICDWFYGNARESYPSYSYFKSLGYDLLACPWDKTDCIVAEAKAAKEADAFGMLGTLWHHYYGTPLALVYTTMASAAWNPAIKTVKPLARANYSLFKTHLRQVCWDMKLKEYEQFGVYHYQLPHENSPR